MQGHLRRKSETHPIDAAFLDNPSFPAIMLPNIRTFKGCEEEEYALHRWLREWGTWWEPRPHDSAEWASEPHGRCLAQMPGGSLSRSCHRYQGKGYRSPIDWKPYPTE